MFTSSRGLGAHMSRAHKDIRDALLAAENPSGPKSRSHWTQAERNAIARQEAIYRLRMNSKLPPNFTRLDTWLKFASGTERSEESLKKQRQSAAYKTELERELEALKNVEAQYADKASASQPVSSESTVSVTVSGNAEPASVGSERHDAYPARLIRDQDWECEIKDLFRADTPSGFKPSPASNVVAAICANRCAAQVRNELGTSFDAWVSQLIGVKTSTDLANDNRRRLRKNKSRRKNRRKNAEPIGQLKDIPEGKQSISTSKGKKSKRTERRAKLRWQAKSAFRADPYLAGKQILNGEHDPHKAPNDSGGTAQPEMSELEDHWGRVFETPSLPCRWAGHNAAPPRFELLKPVTLMEVEVGLRDASLRSTPGPDKLSFRDLRKCRKQDIADWFNVFLLARSPPPSMLRGAVTLVPKTANPTSPSEFRPITVTSAVLRLFHSVLAKRWNDQLQLPVEQRGFRAGIDGCMDNVTMIRHLLRYSKNNNKSLSACFLDISNAFGAVSQNAVLQSAVHFGVPSPMRDYLASVYEGFEVRFKSGSDRTFKVNAGVLQGDPLSSVAFNVVMAKVMADMRHDFGVRSGPGLDGFTTYLSYADDTVLLSETRTGLKANFAKLKGSLAEVGLQLNARKCATFEIESLRKQKKTFVRAESFLTVEQDPIPPLNEREFYRYLGMKFSPSGISGFSNIKALQTGLERITKARIDPQDRLFVLKNVLIPRMNFALCLGEATGKALRERDVLIRKAVRVWLHLPHDTPLGCYHAKARDGGLGVPCLVTDIPRQRAERLRRVLAQQLPLLEGLRNDPKIESALSKACDGGILNAKIIGDFSTKEGARQSWRELLIGSVDGRGLTVAEDCPRSSQWITRPNCGVSGKEFVKAVHVRFNLLKTPARAGRGGRGNMNCPTCRDSIGGLGHYLQKCPRTHGYRVDRHNSVARLIGSFAVKGRSGTQLVKEPAIGNDGRQLTRSEKDSLKPDLVFRHGECVTIVDPTIIADNSDRHRLKREARAKVQRYDVEAVRTWACEKWSIPKESLDFKVFGLPITWRGLCLSEHLEAIIERLRCHKHLRVLLPIRTNVFGWRTWQSFAQKGTAR